MPYIQKEGKVNNLILEIKNSIEEAPDYNTNGEGFSHATLTKAIVVRRGMVSGNDTIDLQFVDEAGNKFVAMVTARILKAVTDQAVT
jgi:hypothetical protein